MNRLISKISIQTDGLIRGNLAQIIGDLDQLCKESGSAEITTSVKITIEKRNGSYFYGGSLAWSKAVKHSDETEMEEYDLQQPDMFNPKANTNPFTTVDTMRCERTLQSDQPPCNAVVTGDEDGCCQCEKQDCDLRIITFGIAGACVAGTACSKECPRYEGTTVK